MVKPISWKITYRCEKIITSFQHFYDIVYQLKSTLKKNEKDRMLHYGTIWSFTITVFSVYPWMIIVSPDHGAPVSATYLLCADVPLRNYSLTHPSPYQQPRMLHHLDWIQIRKLATFSTLSFKNVQCWRLMANIVHHFRSFFRYNHPKYCGNHLTLYTFHVLTSSENPACHLKQNVTWSYKNNSLRLKVS